MERLVLPLLWSSALVFAVIGVFFLALPERAAGSIGVILSDATARTDVRATYGGMMLGTGAFRQLAPSLEYPRAAGPVVSW